MEELSEKIQTILNDPSLVAWKVVGAYVVKEEIENHVIELQNEDEQRATIKPDREGMEIK